MPAGAAVLVLGLLLATITSATLAAWVAVAPNGGNQFTTAASFPNYPTSVTNDGAWAYHREEESPASASTSTAADSSGNSRPGTYNSTTNGPCTWWKFDENGGTTAADSSGGANPGTLNNSPTWTTGPVNSALGFNGSTRYVAGARRAVHTNASLTVAAWVKVTGTAADGFAVSQHGSHTYGFALGLDGATGKWSFNMTNSDTAGATVVKQYSSATATAGVWTQLAGVYDTSIAKTLLYVNGALIGTATKASSWDATGALQAGRAYVSDAWAGYLGGGVDDVRVYNRALSATEISNLAAGSPVTAWNFSEGSGTTTADSGPTGNTGTLSTAGWTTGHAGNAVSFNGTDRIVSGANGTVSTHSSFTVAAWVYLTAKGGFHTAISQDGTAISGFYLQYDFGSDRWAMTMRGSDSTASTLSLALGTSSPTLSTWYHLAGVYDSTAQTAKLYVDGALQATAAFTTPWKATGAFEVGRGKWNSVPADFFTGTIDTVRAYQRALAAADVTALYNDTEPSTATFTEAAATLGVPGALQGTYQGLSASTATAFAGAATAYNNTSANNPTTFTVECWFKVAGSLGGEIIGFHENAPSDAGSHDRTLYLDSGGKLTFGTYVAAAQTVRSPATYNDANWHHAAASLGPAGMKLYVDGSLVATGATTTAGNYTGYWRWGGGTLATMTNRPTSDYLTGSIDEVAVYPTQLTDQQVALHYQRNY